jgi:hypothetical protein
MTNCSFIKLSSLYNGLTTNGIVDNELSGQINKCRVHYVVKIHLVATIF